MRVFFQYAKGVVLPDINIFYVDTANYLNFQWFIRRLNPSPFASGAEAVAVKLSGRHNLNKLGSVFDASFECDRILIGL